MSERTMHHWLQLPRLHQ